jgi:RNA polymerase sigma factor (sigma-70 family)
MAEAAVDFAALVAAARTGDEAALARLAREYEPKVRIVARVLLGPALRPYLDSMDLVQSVHRSLMVGLRQQKFDISSPENLVGLAVTMVRRKAARHWARLQRQQRLSGAGDDRGNLPALLVSLGSPEADPAREAEYQDAVRHLCRKLTDVEQRMLTLRLQGHTTAEVADALGLSPIALRVRLTRLRQRLQDSGVLADWL